MTDTLFSEHLTAKQIAADLGIKVYTWHSYVHRGTAPAADERFHGIPLWKPATITAWKATRKGTPGRPTTKEGRP